MKNCIACNYPISYPLFNPEDQPLAALYLPKTAEAARDIGSYPMNFYTCANCGHIFNIEFDYSKVPYENNSNLMYNAGSGWMDYMDALAERLCKTYGAGTWLEIGCGDGNFLGRIKKIQPDSRTVGFEPGVEARNSALKGVEAIEDYFIPERDLPKYRPDFIICRHVIEHLQIPKDFVAELAYWCDRYGIFPTLIAEVPCIDKAISHARINDYLYEHVSNFTVFSFGNMFKEAGFEILRLEQEYADEVVLAEVRPKQIKRLTEIRESTERYRERIDAQFTNISTTLGEWKKQKKRVAFWGGTGKSASFLNNFNILVEDFPVVIDSDYNKVGRYVPRTAQEIRPPEYIEQNYMEIIVITTQWRAKDIYAEIQRRNIAFGEVYVLLNGKLVPYQGQSI
jgi:hypothetical protein